MKRFNSDQTLRVAIMATLLIMFVFTGCEAGGTDPYGTDAESADNSFPTDSPSVDNPAPFDVPVVCLTTEGGSCHPVDADESDGGTPSECANYEQYNGLDMYCQTQALSGECVVQFVVNLKGICGFTCYGDTAHTAAPADQIEILEPFSIIAPPGSDDPLISCTPL